MKFLLAPALLAATAAAGAPLPRPAGFGTCTICHAVEPGKPSAMGPNLWGVGNRVAGTLPGYAYSPAMKTSRIRWTRDELIAFVTAPKARVPGTKMAYPGLKDPKASAVIADYLLSLK